MIQPGQPPRSTMRFQSYWKASNMVKALWIVVWVQAPQSRCLNGHAPSNLMFSHSQASLMIQRHIVRTGRDALNLYVDGVFIKMDLHGTCDESACNHKSRCYSDTAITIYAYTTTTVIASDNNENTIASPYYPSLHLPPSHDLG